MLGAFLFYKIMKKIEIVNNIIEDLQENFYDSREYLLDLARETLMYRRTIKDLKEYNN